MKKKSKELIATIAARNKLDYNLLKAAEECQELSLVLTQLINKPDKVSKQDIIDEIGDVIIRMEFLKNVFNKEAINKRIEAKIANYNGWLEAETYKNI